MVTNIKEENVTAEISGKITVFDPKDSDIATSKTVKRLPIPQDVLVKLEDLTQFLANNADSLKVGAFKLIYVDDDGDEVAIDSQEDLDKVRDEMAAAKLLKLKAVIAESPEVRPRVNQTFQEQSI